MRVAEVVSCAGGGERVRVAEVSCAGGTRGLHVVETLRGEAGRATSEYSIIRCGAPCGAPCGALCSCIAAPSSPGPYRHHQQRRVAVLVAVLVNAILVASMWQRCVAALAVLPRQSCFDLQRSRLAWSSVLVSVSKAELGLEAVVLAHLVHETALRVGGRCGDSQCMVREPCTAMHLSCESRGNRHVFKTVDGLR